MNDDMKSPMEDFELPPGLRFLRQLVTVLTVVMIVGVVLIAALLVIRLNQPALAIPDQITLPAGAVSYTQTNDWFAVVTDENKILIFDLNGQLTQEVDVKSD
jgi:archaellum component FlaG (FlaF/FlaG flagellin family)